MHLRNAGVTSEDEEEMEPIHGRVRHHGDDVDVRIACHQAGWGGVTGAFRHGGEADGGCLAPPPPLWRMARRPGGGGARRRHWWWRWRWRCPQNVNFQKSETRIKKKKKKIKHGLRSWSVFTRHRVLFVLNWNDEVLR